MLLPSFFSSLCTQTQPRRAHQLIHALKGPEFEFVFPSGHVSCSCAGEEKTHQNVDLRISRRVVIENLQRTFSSEKNVPTSLSLHLLLLLLFLPPPPSPSSPSLPLGGGGTRERVQRRRKGRRNERGGTLSSRLTLCVGVFFKGLAVMEDMYPAGSSLKRRKRGGWVGEGKWGEGKERRGGRREGGKSVAWQSVGLVVH